MENTDNSLTAKKCNFYDPLKDKIELNDLPKIQYAIYFLIDFSLRGLVDICLWI